MKTFLPKETELEKKWLLFDAENEVLGRLAVKIADTLRGKKKAIFTPHLDTGDFVIVINADKVKMTGKKDTDKIYQTYSGHFGGQKEYTADEVRDKHPTKIIQQAVHGMIPHNRLGRLIYKKLFVYAGSEHPHAAQKPEKVN